MKDKVVDVFISLCLFIVGISLLLWAEKVTNTVSLILGIIMILYGLFIAFNYYKSKEKKSIEVIVSIVFMVSGIILVVKPSIISELISIVIGIYVIISSIIKLRNVLDNKESNNYNIGFGLSILGIVLGILCIVGKLLIPNIVLQFVGVVLMIYGITNIINTLVLPSKIKK